LKSGGWRAIVKKVHFVTKKPELDDHGQKSPPAYREEEKKKKKRLTGLKKKGKRISDEEREGVDTGTWERPEIHPRERLAI